MKMTQKMISLLLVAAMLLSASTAATAVDISTSDEINLTGMSAASVTQAVSYYFEARADYLLGNSTVMDWLVVGIANDEAAHMALYNAKGVVLQETVYTIETIECYDTYAEIDAVETISYTKNGIWGTEDVFHELILYLDNTNVPVVAADRYMELCSNFESCSYLPLSVQMCSTASDGGSSLCMVEIAKAELGTEETGTDMTKYGEWYGWNGVAWCAIFVCWCANQANVDTTIIKKTSSCTDMMNFFIDEGVFYYSPSYGGTYAPQPGDLIFTGPTIDRATHIGIVEKVEDGIVHVYDGNWSSKVSYHPYSLSASNIIGYASPAYESDGHIYSGYVSDSEAHWQECTICGYTTEKITHIAGSLYSYDQTTHWKTCRVCEAEIERAAHVLIQNSDGSHECQLCDCPDIPIILLTLKRCLEG